jgi:F0F1-type ATP synthase assembly protein I
VSDAGNPTSEERSHEKHPEERTEQPAGDRESARTRRQGAAYQGAFEAVTAILIAGLAGYFADEHFGTSPRYLILGFLIGFGSFVLRLVRLGRAMQSGSEDEDSTES